MKANLFTDEEQLVTKAIEVLVRELGPVEASRFLALPKKRRVESVKRCSFGDTNSLKELI